jgi:hypothetical protein
VVPTAPVAPHGPSWPLANQQFSKELIEAVLQKKKYWKLLFEAADYTQYTEKLKIIIYLISETTTEAEKEISITEKKGIEQIPDDFCSLFCFEI